MAKKRRFELERASWHDATFQNGTPVEIKSANVSTGYFQIYRKYHHKLRREGGWYAFVVYRPQGAGIKVLKSKMKKADRVALRTRWSPTGGHRDSKKAKVPIDDVFG
jgi:hypothetical protein